MTTRQHLNRARRRSSLIAAPGFAMFVIGMSLSEGQGPLKVVGIVGFVLFFIGILLMLFTGKCLSCDQGLGMVFNHGGGPPWKISEELRFCPYCGNSLDISTINNKEN